MEHVKPVLSHVVTAESAPAGVVARTHDSRPDGSMMIYAAARAGNAGLQDVYTQTCN